MLDNLTVMILVTFFVFIISLLAFSLIRLIRGLSHSDVRLSSMKIIYITQGIRERMIFNRLFLKEIRSHGESHLLWPTLISIMKVRDLMIHWKRFVQGKRDN